MLTKKFSLVSQTTLLLIFFEPIVCLRMHSLNKRSTTAKTHQYVESESLQNNNGYLCGIFVCDSPNKTGLILFNNTVEYTEPESALRKLPANFIDKPFDIEPKPIMKIRDYTCLDVDGQTRQKPYCNRVANYPTHSILESMIKRQFTNFEKLLSQDILLPNEIRQRGSYEPEKDDQYLCDTYQGTIFPKSGTTKNNVWMLIVNDETNYKQGVRTEECVNVNKPCKLVDKPKDYSVTCKQHYRFHTLWAIKDNITISQEQFQIPCCCQCMYKPSAHLLDEDLT